MNLRSTIRHALAPLGVALFLFALWVALLAIPGAWLVVAIFVASTSKATIVSGALAVAAAIVWLFWRRHRISGAAMLCGLMAIVLLASTPTMVKSPGRKLADLVQVTCYRGVLQRQAEELRRKGVSPTVALVAVDGFGSMTSGIAFDPTGEIELTPDKRSKAWLATAGQTELGIEGLEARHIIGHYYSWFHH